MKLNPLTQIDFYKADHRSQYPEGSNLVYANLTPRSDRLYNGTKYWDGKVVNFGLQGFIKWFLIDTFSREFFVQPLEKVVRQYQRRMDNALGADAVSVEHIEELWRLGYLPIEIRALAEGSRSPIKIPVMTIHNTLPEFFWLTNYLETVISNSVWKSYTNATIAAEYRSILNYFYEETSAPKELIPLMCHDFSARGMGHAYDSAQNGAAHLTSFVGTDTVAAIDYVEDYYNADSDKELVGCSVPATEHSVMCMGGQEGEIELFKRLITEVYPAGIVSIVSDTWDFWKVITEYIPSFKEEILNRKENALGLAKVVIRPDSGDPVDILCGYDIRRLVGESQDELEQEALEIIVDRVRDETPHGEMGQMNPSEIFKVGEEYFKFKADIEWNRYDKQYYYIEEYNISSVEKVEATPEMKGAVECLYETFGGEQTVLGYKMLHDRIGLIYGDSITRERCIEILERLKKKGFAASNVVFGIGSFTYQYNTRDTLGWAVKATYGEVNGKGRQLFKDPVTDNGTKKSAKGYLSVFRGFETPGNKALNLEPMESMYMVDEQEFRDAPSKNDLLQPVFRDGELLVDVSLQEIRKKLWN